jgi:hypothetical protein
MTKERLGWWVSIVLSNLFGSKLKIENSEKTVKVFPFVWGGKLHLFGAQYQELQARFEWPYTLSLKNTEKVIRLGKKMTEIKGGENICVILCHLKKSPTEKLLKYLNTNSSNTRIVLAYGGPEEEFQKIRYENKLFIRDPRLRGPTYKFSYFELMENISCWLKEAAIDAKWITIMDYDCIPLHKSWNEEIVRVMELEGAGFGGKIIQDSTNDNSFFVCNALNQGVISKLESIYSGLLLYQCIGCFFCIHISCFNSIIGYKKDFDELFFEVAVPTCARLADYKIISFDKISKITANIRFRPVFDSEAALHLKNSGVLIVHPVKDIEGIMNKALKPSLE